MATVANPQSSNTIEVCFLLTLNLKQVFCIGGFLFPKWLFKVPGIFSQHAASRLTMSVCIKPVQGTRAGIQHVEGFHRPLRKWYTSLHLCSHGWNPVTRPYLTAKESGKCSLIVCPKEEIGGQLAVSAPTSCLGCVSLFMGGGGEGRNKAVRKTILNSSNITDLQHSKYHRAE